MKSRYSVTIITFVFSLFLLAAALTLSMAPLNSMAQQSIGSPRPERLMSLPGTTARMENPEVDAITRSSPIMFIENVGQWDDRARFQVWGDSSGTMWLAEDGIWVTVLEDRPRAEDRRPGSDLGPPSLVDRPSSRQGANVRLSFVGANSQPRIETFDRLDTTVNYFIGDDPDQWRSGVPVWGLVRYVDLYPGVDLEIVGQDGQAVQRFVASPGAETDKVRIAIEGADEAVIEDGWLHLQAGASEFALRLPGSSFAYGVDHGAAGREPVFETVRPQMVDPERTGGSGIDPLHSTSSLQFSTYLGGAANDEETTIAVHPTGQVYVTGSTESTNFPTTPGSFDAGHNGGWDAFVLILDHTGSALVNATFLGGSSWDFARSIAVDAIGRAYVGGITWSGDFPTTVGAHDRSHNGEYDVFVTRLDFSYMEYSTLIGGSASEGAYHLALGPDLSAYVTGYTYSGNYPTTSGAFDRTHNGEVDGFVTKLDSDGQLAYSTFVGASRRDWTSHVVPDASGAALITGATASGDFPTTPGAYDVSYEGGTCGITPDTHPCHDVFVARLNPTATSLVFSTYLGGSADDQGYSVASDAEGRLYVTGTTDSRDFPSTIGAFDTSYNGGEQDSFVARLNAQASLLDYGTYLGGIDEDGGYDISALAEGVICTIGHTASPDFPTTASAWDRSHNGGLDVYIARLDTTGNTLTYGTYLGGSGDSSAWRLVADAVGNIYIAGHTESHDFPTTAGAFDRSHNGATSDAFVAKLAMGVTEPTPTATATSTPHECTQSPSGLVSLWPGDGNAADVTGRNPGAVVGQVAYAVGMVGDAFSFSGASEVRVENSLSLNPQELTIEAWVYPTALDGKVDIIVNKEANRSPFQYEFGIRGSDELGVGSLSQGELAFHLAGLQGWPREYYAWVSGGGIIPTHAWTHVALTFDGSSARAYINGALTRVISGLTGSLTTTTGPLKIGSRADDTIAMDPNDRFNGLIDEVSLYDRALTPAEIQTIFNAGSAGKCKPAATATTTPTPTASRTATPTPSPTPTPTVTPDTTENHSYWFPFVDPESQSNDNIFYSYIDVDSVAPASIFVDANFNDILDAGELTALVEPGLDPLPLFDRQLSGPVHLMSSEPLQAYVWYLSAWSGPWDEKMYYYAPAIPGTQFVVPLTSAHGAVHVVATEADTVLRTASGQLDLQRGEHIALPAVAGEVITASQPVAATYISINRDNRDSTAAASLPPVERFGTEFWVPPDIELRATILDDDRRLILTYADGSVEERPVPAEPSHLTVDRPAALYWFMDVEATDPYPAENRRRQALWAIPAVSQLGTEYANAGYVISSQDANVVRVDADYDGDFEQEFGLDAGEMVPFPYQRQPSPHTYLAEIRQGHVRSDYPLLAWQSHIGSWHGVDEHIGGTEQRPLVLPPPLSSICPPGETIAASSFAVDDEGWTVLNDATGPHHSQTGGNPGGYIYAVDRHTRAYWYWHGPAKFLGDVSAAYGGALRFDLRQSETADQRDQDDVVLSGGGLTIVFDTPANPGTDWTVYEVLLDETAGWRKRGSSGAPTPAEMLSVLSSLSDLQIRGEYSGRADTGSLDNAAICAGSVLPPTPTATPTATPTVPVTQICLSDPKLEPGLVAYYPFDDGTAMDRGPHGNHGTMHGGVHRTDGVYGGGVDFNGSDGYLSVPDSDHLDLVDQFTIGAWVYARDYYRTDQSWITLLNKHLNYGLIYVDGGDRIVPYARFFGANGVYMGSALSSASLTLGRWSYVTWRYDNGTISVFLDGAVVEESDMGTGALATNDLPVEVGRDLHGIAEFFDGRLDELRIYDRAVTDQEVQRLVECAPGTLATPTPTATAMAAAHHIYLPLSVSE